jgi:hypothetical protein
MRMDYISSSVILLLLLLFVFGWSAFASPVSVPFDYNISAFPLFPRSTACSTGSLSLPIIEKKEERIFLSFFFFFLFF